MLGVQPKSVDGSRASARRWEASQRPPPDGTCNELRGSINLF
jgi:hypothetical protein